MLPNKPEPADPNAFVVLLLPRVVPVLLVLPNKLVVPVVVLPNKPPGCGSEVKWSEVKWSSNFKGCEVSPSEFRWRLRIKCIEFNIYT